MSPPTAHEPFLRAICATPDDDAPRLVFADWLDENGDPERAEFIRLHIQLARNPDAVEFDSRCAELLRMSWRAWVTALPGTAGLWAEFAVSRWPSPRATWFEIGDDEGRLDTWIEFAPDLKDWDRGFPATVYVQGSSDVFLANIDRITEFVPVNRLYLLHLDNPDELVRKIAGLPFLSKLRELKLPELVLQDDAAVALANSSYAAGLRRLSLLADRMTDRAGRAFAESPNLGGLEMLHLLHNEFSGSVRRRLRARFGFNVHC